MAVDLMDELDDKEVPDEVMDPEAALRRPFRKKVKEPFGNPIYELRRRVAQGKLTMEEALKENIPDLTSTHVGEINRFILINRRKSHWIEFMIPLADINYHFAKEIEHRGEKGLATIIKAQFIGDLDEADQIERLYLEALELFDAGLYPLQRARTQVELGNLYMARRDGNKEDNLRKARDYFLEAIKILNSQRTAFECAMANTRLGQIFLELNGKDSENLDKAEEHFLKSLEFFSREKYPVHHAINQQHLGMTYLSRPGEGQKEWLEKARRCFEIATSLLNPDNHPTQFATAKAGMAEAIFKLWREDKNTDLQEAIRFFRESLGWLNPKTNKALYGRIQLKFAELWEELPPGEEDENLQNLVKCYKGAIEAFERERFPEQYATAHERLGRVYQRFSTEDTHERLSEAESCFKTALTVFEEMNKGEDCDRIRSYMKENEEKLNRIRSKND
nr:hypothetical protein [Desulfobacterales bacterium]